MYDRPEYAAPDYGAPQAPSADWTAQQAAQLAEPNSASARAAGSRWGGEGEGQGLASELHREGWTDAAETLADEQAKQAEEQAKQADERAKQADERCCWATAPTLQNDEGSWLDEQGVRYSADGKWLLKGNKELKEYAIREGTEVVADEAFSFSDLQDIAFPKSLRAVGKRAFAYCSELLFVHLNDGLRVLGHEAFAHCAGVASVRLPATLEEMRPEAFADCKNLEQVRLEEGLERLGDAAFAWCEGLKEVRLPESLRDIGRCAFAHCAALRTVHLPQSLTAMGDEAFTFCRSLTALELPAALHTMGRGALGHCRELKHLTSRTPHFVLQDGALYDQAMQRLLLVWDKAVVRYVVPDGVRTIDPAAFAYCCNLRQLRLPHSLERIGAEAFSFCFRLPRLTLPMAVREIGARAFADCSESFSVLLSSLPSRLGQDVFKDCRFVVVERGHLSQLLALLPPDQHHKVLEAGRGCNPFWTLLSP